MVAARRRSVPSGATASNPDIDTNQLPTPASRTPQPPSRGPGLVAKAEALARMTYELNLRAVSSQAARLERDLQALVACTTDDKAFREDHERRLQDMWREILAVKARMGEMGGAQTAVRVDFQRCQEEMTAAMEEYGREMSELRGLVQGVSSQMDQLPTAAEVDDDPAGKASVSTGVETRAMTRAKQRAHQESQPQQEPDYPSPNTIKCRIREAVNSTRRWNRDHKCTDLDDGAFTAKYLRQQSKRDPAMAVYIQRHVQRRVRRRLPRSQSRPENLEEFCRDVEWPDVTQTVENVLIAGEEQAIRALREER